jgi:hypothetical protein
MGPVWTEWDPVVLKRTALVDRNKLLLFLILSIYKYDPFQGHRLALLPLVCSWPKFPDCYCCNCLSEIRWKGRPRSHFRKPVASVCHKTPCCFYTSAFLTSCFVFAAMDGKIEQRVYIKFCVKLTKSATETCATFPRSLFPDSWKTTKSGSA